MKEQFGEDHPNSCAIRLAFALEALDSDFFRAFRSDANFQGKPIRARELADYLGHHIPGGQSIPTGAKGKDALAGRNGIVYFEKIRPLPGKTGVSWHISLWDG